MTAETTVAERVSEPTAQPRRRRALAAAAAATLTATALGSLYWPAAPRTTELHAGTPRYVVATTFTSLRIGMTDVALALDPRNPGAAATEVRNVWIQAVMPTMGHATGRVPAEPADHEGSGTADRYRVSGLPLMMTGPWQLLVSITYAGGNDDLSFPFWVSG